MTLPAWVSLLRPADPGCPTTITEAGTHWTWTGAGSGQDHVVWGRDHAPAGAPFGEALRGGLDRELALLRLRWPPLRGGRVTAHRLHAPAFDRNWLRDAVRTRLLAGLVVEIAPRSGPPVRLLDVVARQAEVVEPLGPLRGAADGSLILRVRTTTGPAVLRLAPAGAADGLLRAGEALVRLEGRAGAPRLFAHGEVDDVHWVTEELLPGARPRKVPWRAACEVSVRLAQLPAADGPALATLEDLAQLIQLVPDHRETLEGMASRVRAAEGSLPTIARHGDLWRGNLLCRGRRLAGVVDWDAWHPRAVAGADLLQLVAAERRRIERRSLGEEWRTAPWRSAVFRRLSAPYWRALGVEPGPADLEAVGIAWWAAEAAGTLRRLPHRALDDAWLERNVLNVTPPGRGTSVPTPSVVG